MFIIDEEKNLENNTDNNEQQDNIENKGTGETNEKPETVDDSNKKDTSTDKDKEHFVPLDALKKEREKYKGKLNEAKKYEEFVNKLQKITGKNLDDLEYELQNQAQRYQQSQQGYPHNQQGYQQNYNRNNQQYNQYSQQAQRYGQQPPQYQDNELKKKLEDLEGTIQKRDMIEKLKDLSKREYYRSIRGNEEEIVDYAKAKGLDVLEAMYATYGDKFVKDAAQLSRSSSTSEEDDSEKESNKNKNKLDFSPSGNSYEGIIKANLTESEKEAARLTGLTESQYAFAKAAKNMTPAQIHSYYQERRKNRKK